MLTLGVTTLHTLSKLGVGDIGTSVLCFGLVFLAIFAAGLVAARLMLRVPPRDPIAEAAVVLALGITVYGALLVLLGFFPLLDRSALAITTAGLVLLAGPCRTDAARIGRGVVSASLDGLRREWIVCIPAILLVVAAIAAGFRPPDAPDEVAYHWAAPVIWAHAGRWVTTPFRFTNGFHLSAVLYTPAAVFKSPTAAHWLHTLTFVLLMLGAAALARRFGGSGALAAAGIVAIPAAFGQSWLAYDDVFAASLMIAACVVVTAGVDTGYLWAGGVSIAGALSVKPLLIFMVPAVVVLAWWSGRERTVRGGTFRRATASLVPLGLPGVVASLGWFAYTKWAIGRWSQGAGLVVSHFGRDPSHGLATIRLPRVIDVLMIPFNPLVSGVVGNRQPFGGRTGLIVTMSIPLIVVTALMMNRAARRNVTELGFAALAAYLTASTLIVRTRFLITVYVLIVAAVAVAVLWWKASRPRLQSNVVNWLFRLCVIGGMVDSARYLR